MLNDIISLINTEYPGNNDIDINPNIIDEILRPSEIDNIQFED